MELKAEIDSIKARIEGIKRQLIDKVNVLPQNQAIKPVAKNCFILNSRDLNTKNWSPEYYDFKCQYQRIIDIIESTELLKVQDRITQILKDKKIRLPKGYTFYFNDEVVKFLTEIFK